MEDMETGSESIESGAESGASSDASGLESNGGAQAQAQAPEKQEMPFHEHPRFKELVEQKNSYQKQMQDMESRYKTLEQQFSSIKESQPKPQTETDALLADLQKIDPRLANVISQQLKAAETSKAIQERLDQYEKQSQESQRQQTLSNAVSKINSLHESNKMSDFGKQFINNQLDLAYRSGQLNASDLKAVEQAYSESAKAIKSYEDSLKRDVTKSYVESKSKDAAVPTSVPKGAQAKPAQKQVPTFKSKEDLRAAVVKAYAKETAAAKEAVNNS